MWKDSKRWQLFRLLPPVWEIWMNSQDPCSKMTYTAFQMGSEPIAGWWSLSIYPSLSCSLSPSTTITLLFNKTIFKENECIPQSSLVLTCKNYHSILSKNFDRFVEIITYYAAASHRIRNSMRYGRTDHRKRYFSLLLKNINKHGLAFIWDSRKKKNKRKLGTTTCMLNLLKM